jgi:hypothetical protein
MLRLEGDKGMATRLVHLVMALAIMVLLIFVLREQAQPQRGVFLELPFDLIDELTLHY